MSKGGNQMFLVAVGLAGLLFGIGSSEVRKFERSAANDVSSRLSGEHRVVRVRTKMDPLQAMGGRLKSATITASQFSVEGLPLFTEAEGSRRGRLDELKLNLTDFNLTGLDVKSLSARIPGCRFDWGLAQRKGQIRLTESGTGVGSVRVERAALRKYVGVKHPTLQIDQFDLALGEILIKGRGKFLGFESAVMIHGRLASLDGYAISIVDADIELNGQSAQPATRDAILALLNPVLDLNKDLKLYGALRIQTIQVTPEMVVVTGDASIPARPLGTWIGRIGLYLP